MDQVLAIAWLRCRLSINRMRREEGTTAWAGGTVVLLLSLLFSLGLAFGLGLLARNGIADESISLMRLAWLGAFWSAVVFGLMMPLVLATGSSGVEPSRLLLFLR